MINAFCICDLLLFFYKRHELRHEHHCTSQYFCLIPENIEATVDWWISLTFWFCYCAAVYPRLHVSLLLFSCILYMIYFLVFLVLLKLFLCLVILFNTFLCGINSSFYSLYFKIMYSALRSSFYALYKCLLNISLIIIIINIPFHCLAVIPAVFCGYYNYILDIS